MHQLLHRNSKHMDYHNLFVRKGVKMEYTETQFPIADTFAKVPDTIFIKLRYSDGIEVDT